MQVLCQTLHRLTDYDVGTTICTWGHHEMGLAVAYLLMMAVPPRATLKWLSPAALAFSLQYVKTTVITH